MSLALGIGRYVVLDDSASEKTTSQKNSGVQASEGAQMFFRARKQQGIVTGLAHCNKLLIQERREEMRTGIAAPHRRSSTVASVVGPLVRKCTTKGNDKFLGKSLSKIWLNLTLRFEQSG